MRSKLNCEPDNAERNNKTIENRIFINNSMIFSLDNNTDLEILLGSNNDKGKKFILSKTIHSRFILQEIVDGRIGRWVELVYGNPINLGRNDESDSIFDMSFAKYSTVSREHLKIELERFSEEEPINHVILTDLGSTNGTSVVVKKHKAPSAEHNSDEDEDNVKSFKNTEKVDEKVKEKLETLYKEGFLKKFNIEKGQENMGDLIYDFHGRKIVLVNILDQVIPFYCSFEGNSGKKAGTWYPFFGFMNYSDDFYNIKNLFIKGGENSGTEEQQNEELDNSYGLDCIKNAKEKLNSSFGDIRSLKVKGFEKNEDFFTDHINNVFLFPKPKNGGSNEVHNRIRMIVGSIRKKELEEKTETETNRLLRAINTNNTLDPSDVNETERIIKTFTSKKDKFTPRVISHIDYDKNGINTSGDFYTEDIFKNDLEYINKAKEYYSEENEYLHAQLHLLYIPRIQKLRTDVINNVVSSQDFQKECEIYFNETLKLNYSLREKLADLNFAFNQAKLKRLEAIKMENSKHLVDLKINEEEYQRILGNKNDFSESELIDIAQRMFGISDGNNFKEVTQAYKKASMKFHPDRSRNEKDHLKFNIISSFYNKFYKPTFSH